MSQRKPDENNLVRLLMGSQEKQLMTPKEMVSHLQEKGYKIVRDDPAAEQRKAAKIASFNKLRWEGGRVVKFGALSCTHLGSRQQQLTFLHTFYDRCSDGGIEHVFHMGDMTDGDGRVYKGQQFDSFLHGVDMQRDYVIEKYPSRKGVLTHLIAGNHDWSFWERGGYDVLKAVAGQRPDIRYYGAYGMTILLDGVHVYMSHGDGGLAYARSYKPQRRIEQFAPEQKPEVYFLGHYHVWDHLPMYRNVVGWQMGCFQSQTDYLKRKGVYPELGGVIVTIYLGTAGADRPNGFVRVIDEVVPFYVPKENDF